MIKLAWITQKLSVIVKVIDFNWWLSYSPKIRNHKKHLSFRTTSLPSMRITICRSRWRCININYCCAQSAFDEIDLKLSMSQQNTNTHTETWQRYVFSNHRRRLDLYGGVKTTNIWSVRRKISFVIEIKKISIFVVLSGVSSMSPSIQTHKKNVLIYRLFPNGNLTTRNMDDNVNAA